MREALESAREAALAGGRVIKDKLGTTGAVRSKSSPTDLVTDVDIEAGIAVARALHAAHPGARLIVEENEVYALAGVERGELSDPEVWLVDPIDGTTSFVHGFPCYSVAVALLRSGVPVVGAVYNVALDELVSAAHGAGATSNGHPIRCSATGRLDEALVVTGFPYDRGELLDHQLSILRSFLRAPVHGVRRDGSAAVDCTHVAMGRADGFWEFGLKPWDMAAGVVICHEAGAVVTGVDGEPWNAHSTGIVTANPGLHALMLDVIRSHQLPGTQ